MLVTHRFSPILDAEMTKDSDQKLVLIVDDTPTNVAVVSGVTISSTYGTTHTNIDFTGRGSVTLVGYSATHWKVRSVYGLVAFS